MSPLFGSFSAAGSRIERTVVYSPFSNARFAASRGDSCARAGNTRIAAATAKKRRVGAPPRILRGLPVRRVHVDDLHSHSIFQVHVSGQGDNLAFLQSAEHFVICGVGDAYLDGPAFERRPADSIFYDK